MGRGLTFSDPEIIRLARETFVPVVADDWYQRRRLDAEGEFFRAVADQGPRRHDGAGGPTRQGLYLLTASGRLLGYRNHHDPEVMLGVIRSALAAWEALPGTEREPGGLEVPPLEVDPRYHRATPGGALVLRSHTRVLERGATGALERCDDLPSGVRGRAPSRDQAWVLADEWRAMAPGADAAPGDEVALPRTLVERLCRFHLVDATRGEPPFWSRGDLRATELALRVESRTKDTVTLSLAGRVLLATQDEARGFDASLRGTLEYDAPGARFVRFDLIVLGDHWGEGRWNRGARAGRTPLGIVFAIVDDGAHGRDVPPQGARDLSGYLAPR